MICLNGHGVVPATDDADLYIWPVAQHMREIDSTHLHENLALWCKRWAPEVPSEEIEQIADRVLSKGYRFKADTLAEKLLVTHAERKALRLTTIGAVDRPKHERANDR